jgi:hypothetical protein
MLSLRAPLQVLVALAALPLSAQTVPERVERGFKTLSTGNWETALREWTRDGMWSDAEGRIQQKLEGWIPGPRTIGRWESVNLPQITPAWQRHWMMATFDQGVVFLIFDFALHKGQWRLLRMQVAQDPAEALPHLDLLPAILASRAQ